MPLTLAQANEYVEANHRHHRKVVSHRFSIGAVDNGQLVGVCICGRPVARGYDPYRVLEVTRLCTTGAKNVCSKLYSAAARIAKEMGFERIQTYILEGESGTSLSASGWDYEHTTQGGSWNQRPDGCTRSNNHPTVRKKLYSRTFTEVNP